MGDEHGRARPALRCDCEEPSAPAGSPNHGKPARADAGKRRRLRGGLFSANTSIVTGQDSTEEMEATIRIVQGPRVSVVIASDRVRDSLGDCLRSLAAQTEAPDFEVLVASAIEPEAPAGRPFPFAWVTVEDRNPALRRNRAAREARGEILAFLDDDAQAEPGWLAAGARALDRCSIAGGPDLLTPGASYAERLSDLLLATPGIGSGVPAHERFPRGGAVRSAHDVALCNLFARREAFECSRRFRRDARLHLGGYGFRAPRSRIGLARGARSDRPRASSPPAVSRRVPRAALALSGQDRANAPGAAGRARARAHRPLSRRRVLLHRRGGALRAGLRCARAPASTPRRRGPSLFRSGGATRFSFPPSRSRSPCITRRTSGACSPGWRAARCPSSGLRAPARRRRGAALEEPRPRGPLGARAGDAAALSHPRHDQPLQLEVCDVLLLGPPERQPPPRDDRSRSTTARSRTCRRSTPSS